MILEIYDAFKWTLMIIFGGTFGLLAGSALVELL